VSGDDVLIIGAGPYGVSISAYLSALGIGHRIVGRPMDTWRTHMPVGMNLKSEPYASAIASPNPGYDVGAYSRQHQLTYVDRVGPVSIERFIDYADWYTKQLVPDVRDLTVTSIEPSDRGFRVGFADADGLSVKQVVVATGILPHATIPDELSGLPAELVSHSADHHTLSRFRGQRVAVVGAGQSALETAALLHEAGAEALLVVRRPGVIWLDPNPETISRLGHVKRPVTQLCEGWHCAFWNSPAAFRLLPENVRITKARTVLGPAGAWWLKDRVEGQLEVLTGHRVLNARAEGNGAHLVLEGPSRSTLDVDHVIAGTGFRIDLARLTFLSETLRAKLTTLNGYPVLSRAAESTVPGLYFVGAPAAVSLGPSMRFIAGTHNVASQAARAVARGLRTAAKVSAEADATDRIPAERL
jgi:FAD-dependent urate hydroxylase